MSRSPSSRHLAFAIHDLNPWGGHDRSTLEIARRLSHRWPVEIIAYSFKDPSGEMNWGEREFHRVLPDPHRPTAARIGWFYAGALAQLELIPRLKRVRPPLIHATGTCALRADVVQVQFVNTAWKEVQRSLPREVFEHPFTRGRSGIFPWLRSRYHQLLLEHNVAMERRLYTRKKRYVAIADCVRRELEHYFGLNEQVCVIRHGVDSAVFRSAQGDTRLEAARDLLRREQGVSPEETVILFVGAYERKGLATAIDAVARLDSELRSRVQLWAVGGGAAEGFRARAQKIGVSDRVKFFPPQKQISAWYQAADLFVLPTLYEPFGLVALEALATGLPSIISAQAGASELTRHGESALLLREPGRPEELAHHLAKVLQDRSLQERLSRAGREVASRRSWDQVAREYEEFLGPLMAESEAG